MTIAPLDHLWVRGSVSELDADKVEVGQEVKVDLPVRGPDREIKSKIDYIEKAIDPDTRSAKFRTTIPNPEGRFKAGAFVKVQVYIPPKAGQTVIPRSAMVSVDSSRLRLHPQAGQDRRTFERRPIIAAKESNDIVVVAEPPKATAS